MIYNMIYIVARILFYFKLVRSRFPSRRMICYRYYSTDHYIKTKKNYRMKTNHLYYISTMCTFLIYKGNEVMKTIIVSIYNKV